MASLIREASDVTDATRLSLWIDQQMAVDTTPQDRTVGPCMADRKVYRTVSHFPRTSRRRRYRFHGVNLANSQCPDSPHRRHPHNDARMLMRLPRTMMPRLEVKTNITHAFWPRLNIPAEIEVYAGSCNGWTHADFPPTSRLWQTLLGADC